MFYKVLEKHYTLEPLKPLYREGVAESVNGYLKKLGELFSRAVEITGDFEPVFSTGIYDQLDIGEDEEVSKALDWLAEPIDEYDIERFGLSLATSTRT